MFKYCHNSWLWPYNLWEENGYHMCKLLSSAVTTLTLSLECVASCVVTWCLSDLPMDYPESNGCVFWEQLESKFQLNCIEVLMEHFRLLLWCQRERKQRSWYSSLHVQQMGSELVGVCAVFCETQGQPIQIFVSEHDCETGFGVVLHVKGSFWHDLSTGVRV